MPGNILQDTCKTGEQKSQILKWLFGLKMQIRHYEMKNRQEFQELVNHSQAFQVLVQESMMHLELPQMKKQIHYYLKSLLKTMRHLPMIIWLVLHIMRIISLEVTMKYNLHSFSCKSTATQLRHEDLKYMYLYSLYVIKGNKKGQRKKVWGHLEELLFTYTKKYPDGFGVNILFSYILFTLSFTFLLDATSQVQNKV